MASKRKSVKDGTMVGVGVLLVGGLAALIVWFFWRQKQNQQLQLQAGARRQKQLQAAQVQAAARTAAVPGDSVTVNNPRTGDEILVSVR